MKFISLLLLLIPSLCFAQPITIGTRPTDLEVLHAKKTVERYSSTSSGTMTVGGQYTTAELEKAKETLAGAAPKSLAIKSGEFEVIEPAKTVAGPLLWVVSDDTCITRISIPAKTPFVIWGIRRGETEARLHEFEAKPFAWVLLIGAKQGTTSIQIIRNGASLTEPPVIVDRINATVGTPIPKPIDPPVKPDDPKPDDPKPISDALVKELKELLTKDRAASTGDQWKYAAIWAESFVDSSKLLKLNDPAIAPKNLAELYAKHKAAWIADDVPVLPFLSNTRIRIATMLESELGKDPAAPLDRNKASEVYLRIGNALKEALK